MLEENRIKQGPFVVLRIEKDILNSMPFCPFIPLDFLSFWFVCFFAFSRAAPAVYGGSQARGLIRSIAAGLRQSHSNVGSEPRLQPTPQLMATPDP